MAAVARVKIMSPTFYRLAYSPDRDSRDRRVLKALSSHSRNILFSSEWLQDQSVFFEIRSALVAKERDVALQISHAELLSAKADFVNTLLRSFSRIIITFKPHERVMSGHLDTFYDFKDKFLFLLDFNESFETISFFSCLPVWIRQQMHFHPCSLKLKAKQIHELGKQIITQFPEIKFRPVPGLDQYDLRISEEVELALTGDRKIHHQTEASDIKISVILPTYDNQDYLLNCIRHLLDQDLPRNEFEIIVVDDGSPNLNLQTVQSFLLPEAGQLNFSYFYLPKKMIPQSFFGNFRAGLCRNFGVHHSRGEAITFLDSDMLVPRKYLQNALAGLEHADLIQSVRQHIHPAKSTRFASYQQITKKELFIEEKNYWGPFFAAADWMSIPDFWKYTCTYSLTMRRSFFEKIGQFRKSYVSYGFEDTDFGYQAFMQGARFYLDKTPLYHLTPYADKSRYKHSMFYKHQLLRLTAKTFYVNSLSPDIFSKMRTLLD